MRMHVMVWISSILWVAAAGAKPRSGEFYWRNAPPEAGVPRQKRPEPGPPLLREGARVYGERCAICHGDGGRGDGIIASRLVNRPRDFTQAVYKVRSTPSGALPTDLDLFQTVSRGMHGTDMAPWARLSERQRWALVAYLQTLSPRFRTEEAEPAINVPRTPAAARQAGLRRRGEALYQTLQCRNCHGPLGRGDGPAVLAYATEPDRVRIRDLGRADFVRGDTPRDIYLTLRTGMDGTPMGALELAPDELWALAFYVHDVLRRPPVPQPGPRATDPEANASH
jgi:mono/diheme cytochrome c family protein